MIPARVLAELSYEDYLRTRHWRELRLRALGKWNGLCEDCGSSTATEVHHRTYERLGREELRDLVPLCTDCHRNTHREAPSRPSHDPRAPAQAGSSGVGQAQPLAGIVTSRDGAGIVGSTTERQ